MPERRTTERRDGGDRRVPSPDPLVALEQRLNEQMDARFEAMGKTLGKTLRDHRDTLGETMRAIADRVGDVAGEARELKGYQREANGRLGKHDVLIAEVNQEVKLSLGEIKATLGRLESGQVKRDDQVDNLRLQRATETGRRAGILTVVVVARETASKLSPFLATGAGFGLAGAAVAWFKGWL